MKDDIVIISTNDWNGFWFQRQEFACRFAKEGYRVFFINRIPQRLPKPKRLIRWIFAKKQVSELINSVPLGVYVCSPTLLPPLAFLRPINRLLWRFFWKKSSIEPVQPILITYQPTYNVLDVIPLLTAKRIIYVNTHNYNADPACPQDLLNSEAELVKAADALLADASYNVRRLESYRPSVPVHRAMPGVAVERFASAYRGDEAEKHRTLMFFGDIGIHLDIPIYNALAEQYSVVFIGIVDKAVAHSISGDISVLPPVPPKELPQLLRNADILTIFYRKSSYVDGILPAKLFECLATGKPLLVSGLAETEFYEEVLYRIDESAEEARKTIEQLPQTETEERKAKRLAVAHSAAWSERYTQFKENAGIE